MKNIRELSEFRNYWRDSEDYAPENRGNDRVIYDVNVIYNWNKSPKMVSFKTTMIAYVGAGPSDGRVDFDEVSNICIDNFHLSFIPNFQEYEFNKQTGDFIISGNSDKMGGDYKVIASPDMRKPK